MASGPRRIATTIHSVLADAYGVDVSELTPQTALYDDLGADSLSIMEMLCALEEELGIELPDSNSFAMGLRTVGDVVGAFESRAP
jgi:acyl carrier protein